MGAWGVGPFDNDDAVDWAYELEESSGVEAIQAALDAVEPDTYLEAPDCSMALAAAEVVAALNGQPHESLPLEVSSWVADHSDEIDEDLLGLALLAIHRIETESELKDLWEESEEYAAWLATVADLKDRLSAP